LTQPLACNYTPRSSSKPGSIDLARAAEKLAHKDTHETDPFVGLMSPLAEGLERNWKWLLGTGGAVLLAAFAVAIGLTLSARRNESAAQRLGEALIAAGKPVEPPAPEAKAPEKPGTKETKESDSFASETEKQEAIAKGLEEVVNKYPTTGSARTALLGLGDARYRLGKFAPAEESYRRYLKESPPEDTLRAFAWIGEAYAVLGQGKGDDALAAARHLVDEAPAGFGRDLGLWAEGKIAEELRRTADARKAYQQLKAEFPDTQLGRDAGERLAALGEPATTITIPPHVGP
jgi:TolA-binding protein